jgi:hypothetical protein
MNLIHPPCSKNAQKMYIKTKLNIIKMKYYESILNEYVEKVSLYNIHENNIQLKRLHELNTIENTIFYGPSGIGKYSQVLYLLSKKNVNLKYQQKLFIQKDTTDKSDKFIYLTSDIYFEIDMELLGCSSKTLWHDIFLQILDIVMINKKQIGIIVCKNFHFIHSELLDIFYSYLQNNKYKNINIKYILITEQISFIPDNLLNNFIVVNLSRPNIDIYKNIFNLKSSNNNFNEYSYNNENDNDNENKDGENKNNNHNRTDINNNKNNEDNKNETSTNINASETGRVFACNTKVRNGDINYNSGQNYVHIENDNDNADDDDNYKKIRKGDINYNSEQKYVHNENDNNNDNDNTNDNDNKKLHKIMNIKDIYNKKIVENITLNKICDDIIKLIKNSKSIIITEFRDKLYEILIYGLNINECLFYIYKKKIFDNNKYSINNMMELIYDFLKKFNNNYRPITHLESIFVLFILYYENYLLNKINN